MLDDGMGFMPAAVAAGNRITKWTSNGSPREGWRCVVGIWAAARTSLVS
jgi:hypothetical protein